MILIAKLTRHGRRGTIRRLCCPALWGFLWRASGAGCRCLSDRVQCNGSPHSNPPQTFPITLRHNSKNTAACMAVFAGQSPHPFPPARCRVAPPPQVQSCTFPPQVQSCTATPGAELHLSTSGAELHRHPRCRVEKRFVSCPVLSCIIELVSLSCVCLCTRLCEPSLLSSLPFLLSSLPSLHASLLPLSLPPSLPPSLHPLVCFIPTKTYTLWIAQTPNSHTLHAMQLRLFHGRRPSGPFAPHLSRSSASLPPAAPPPSPPQDSRQSNRVACLARPMSLILASWTCP